MDKQHQFSEDKEGSGSEVPPYSGNIHDIVQDKGMRMGEAADVYGDIGSAEEYGYVTRGLVDRRAHLCNRHI